MGSFFSFDAINLSSSDTPFCKDGNIEYITKKYNKNLFGVNIAYQSIDDNDNRNDSTDSGGTSNNDYGRFIPSTILESIYRQQGDTEIDTILVQLMKENRTIGPSDDLLQLAHDCYQQSLVDTNYFTTSNEGNSTANQLLAKFYNHYSNINQQPLWYNSKQIERGRIVFLAYYGAIGISLFYRSLAPGFSIPKIAAVLATTGYLAPPSNRRSVQNRLLDTGAFICSILSQPTSESLCPISGIGWKSTLQVRILHAKVRHTLLYKSKSSTSRKWDTDNLGIPINQEDLSMVLLAFSMNSLFGCEIILGFPLSEQEQCDYLAFWRYIGWLLGVQCDETTANTNNDNDEDSNTNNDKTSSSSSSIIRPIDPCGPGWIPTLPNPLAHAVACSYSHALHLMKPDKTSVTMCHHILRAGRPPASPIVVKKDKDSSSSSSVTNNNHDSDIRFCISSMLCRSFIGNELANFLELPISQNVIQRCYVKCFTVSLLCFLRLYTWAALPWSPFRSYIISFHEWHCGKLLQKWQDGTILKKSQEKSRLTDDTTTILPTGGSSCPFAMVAPPSLPAQ